MTATTTGPPPAPDGDVPAPPLLRVLRGNPDDAELAALVAVVAARAAAPACRGEQAPVSPWDDPAHRLGVGALGPHAWATSGRGHR